MAKDIGGAGTGTRTLDIPRDQEIRVSIMLKLIGCAQMLKPRCCSRPELSVRGISVAVLLSAPTAWENC
jgi:hypothetical protein